MDFFRIQTRAFLPPKDDLYALLDEFLPPLEDGDILVIASKILSIHQGRCIRISEAPSKDELILREAERYVPREEVPGKYAVLAVKGHTLIPSAGIDESNANGHYILWPENINTLLGELRAYLKKKHAAKNLALIAADSHSTPLRKGLVGISIGFCGMKPLKDYRGKHDIFGRELKVSQSNIVDAIAAMGVALMGEGDERTPIVILRSADFVEFTEEDVYADLIVEPENDIYAPLFKAFRGKEKT